jgi:myosin-1
MGFTCARKIALLPAHKITFLSEFCPSPPFRHASDGIYTFIGHVLVVVNPYKWLKIYEETTMKRYVNKSRVDVAPHIFSTAEDAYRTMMNEEDNQCVIISGESGAGKTEASKQIQNYIAAVSGNGDGVERVKRIFLESNPLLEAFGNAKTLRNNNSSRFGKYFELMFDSLGRPQGGVITNYLLEKSRIVKPGKGERNFHIFYQLLSGMPSKQAQAFKTSGLGPDDFPYLSASGCFQVDGIDDKKEVDDTMKAMQEMGMKGKERSAIFNLVASVLHIGGIKFKGKKVKDAEGTKIESKDPLERVSGLLGFNAGALDHALCFKMLQTMAAGGKVEVYEVPNNPTKALAARDALAKVLYERLFNYLVKRVNQALDIQKQMDNVTDGVNLEDTLSIGVLDIYGFEIFDKNGFEQFCINYVNEKLQQIFIQLTLKTEQEEYNAEGIDWKPIKFFNNEVVCQLIEGKRPPGIFLILDDTCKTMHAAREGVNETFLDKINGQHGSHRHFAKRGKEFEVNHYAGDVSYSVQGFAEANKDVLGNDLLEVIKGSKDKLLMALFPEEVNWDNKKAPPTSGSRIRTQCNQLVNKLMDCSPHYVRCMKSNDEKKANMIDDKRMEHQAKYLGLLENIKVRRAGYAYRAEFFRFLERFKLLSRETYPAWNGSDKAGAKAICKSVQKTMPSLNKDEVQFGKTKIFIRQPETYFELEKLREDAIGAFVAVIQKAWRKFMNRRQFVKLRLDAGKLYEEKGKQRARASIYRPFDGDYIKDEIIRNEVLDIIEFYSEDERIVFADNLLKAVAANAKVEEARVPLRGRSAVIHNFIYNSNSKSNGAVALEPRILVITNAAVYVMEIVSRSKFEDTKTIAKGGFFGLGEVEVYPYNFPTVHLRRRTPLDMLQSVHMSKLADDVICLCMEPDVLKREPDKSKWQNDDLVSACPDTKTSFGLFNRKHHCRASGRIYCDEVCNVLLPCPDNGWYQPVRVHNSQVGFFSTEMHQDAILLSQKKTEILACLQNVMTKKSKKNKLRATFNNNTVLRGATNPTLTNVPATKVRLSCA